MIRALIVTIGLASSVGTAWAYHVIEQPEDAYELSLGAVTLPANDRGTVIFTACPTCRTTTLRVSQLTQYFANGDPIELSDLRDLADGLRATASGRDSTSVYIYYDKASLRVNRLAMSYR